MDDSLRTYVAMETEGKSQVELVLQVYDGAVKAYRAASEHFKAEEYQEGREELEKAKRFIVHLYTTLDSDKGGEVAENLGKLYTYCICQTMVAESTKDLVVIDDILTVVNNLRDGWKELAQQQQQPSDSTKSAEASVPATTPERSFSTSA